MPVAPSHRASVWTAGRHPARNRRSGPGLSPPFPILLIADKRWLWTSWTADMHPSRSAIVPIRRRTSPTPRLTAEPCGSLKANAALPTMTAPTNATGIARQPMKGMSDHPAPPAKRHKPTERIARGVTLMRGRSCRSAAVGVSLPPESLSDTRLSPAAAYQTAPCSLSLKIQRQSSISCGLSVRSSGGSSRTGNDMAFQFNPKARAPSRVPVCMYTFVGRRPSFAPIRSAVS